MRGAALVRHEDIAAFLHIWIGFVVSSLEKLAAGSEKHTAARKSQKAAILE